MPTPEPTRAQIDASNEAAPSNGRATPPLAGGHGYFVTPQGIPSDSPFDISLPAAEGVKKIETPNIPDMAGRRLAF